jgi:integrase
MSRDLSARPHEILKLKIKDIVFKTVDKYQYAEVLVNGKTGSRSIPLIQSIPYVKDWLSSHPSRNNSNSPLFVSLSKVSLHRQLSRSALDQIYREYQKTFFPKLLEDHYFKAMQSVRSSTFLLLVFNGLQTYTFCII